MDIQGVNEQQYGHNHIKSKEADLLEIEGTSEKVKYDQYAVFAKQQRLDDLNYSKNSIRDED